VAVHTPERVAAAASRAELVAQLKAGGLTAEEVRREVAGRLAGRVGIGGGPGGPTRPAPRIAPGPPGPVPAKAYAPRKGKGKAEPEAVAQVTAHLKLKPEAVGAAIGGAAVDVATFQAEVDRLRTQMAEARSTGDQAEADRLRAVYLEALARRDAAREAAAAREMAERAARLGERLQAWTEGDAHVRAVADLEAPGTPLRRARQEVRHHEAVRTLLEEDIQAAVKEGRSPTDLHQRVLEVKRDLIAARDAYDAAVRASDARLHEIVGLTEKERMEWATRFSGKKAEGIRGVQQAAESYLTPLVGRPASGTTGQIAWKVLPPRDDRAYYHSGTRSVHLTTDDAVAIAVHEWGHAVEAQVPGLEQLAHDFHAYRTAGETPQKLADLFPAHGYEPDEAGVADRWQDHFGETRAYYVGKTYEHGATEILSMGVEALYRDPAGFARNDPEYAKFIIGVLRGDLRGDQP
jgi:hypothetical protein